MSPYLQLPETEFANAGPGARQGLRLIFPTLPKGESQKDNLLRLSVMRFLSDSTKQRVYWDRLGFSSSIPGPIDVNGDPLLGAKREITIIEVEHSLCEMNKAHLSGDLRKTKVSDSSKREWSKAKLATAYGPKRFPAGWRDRVVAAKAKGEDEDEVGGMVESGRAKARASVAGKSGCKIEDAPAMDIDMKKKTK